jgi:DNA-directed RNA polymerase subunit alpha
MASGMVTDVRSLVLESEEFGESQVAIIREMLANDASAVRQLREVARALQDRLRSASGKQKKDLKKRLGVVEYLLGRCVTAQIHLADAGEDPFALQYLGRAYMARGQYEEAAEVFARAAEAGMDPVSATLARVGALRAAGKLQEASSLFQSVADKARDTAEYHYQLGSILAEQGERLEALRAFEHALTLDPNHPEALFRAAYLYDLYGDDERAQELYERCVSRAPVHLGALINLGILYEVQGKYERAARCFQRVLNVYPANPRARLYYEDAKASLTMRVDETTEKKHDRLTQLLKRPIAEFELSVRARNCLKKMGIETLGDLVACTEEDLIKEKNFGDTSLQEIKTLLDQHGLRLGMFYRPKLLPAASPEGGPDPELLQKPVTELNLSARARKCLQKLHIETIGQLLQHSIQDLLNVKNFGETSLQEIKERLAELGLKLPGEA